MFGRRPSVAAIARISRPSIMVCAFRPVLRDPQAPGLNQATARQCWVQLGVTLREPQPASLDQWVIVKPLRHKKAEALEHRPIPQGFGVADEGVSIRLSIGEVVFETALDVPKATSSGRISE